MKRLFAFLLALVIVVGMIPTSAVLATDTEELPTESTAPIGEEVPTEKTPAEEETEPEATECPVVVDASDDENTPVGSIDHVHEYDDYWPIYSYDETYHWYQCIDPHCPDLEGSIKDKGTHSNHYDILVCDKCEYSAYSIAVGGVGLNNNQYLAVGATEATTTKPADNYAYYNDGVLTLHNYSYSGDGCPFYLFDDPYYASGTCAIWSLRPYTVVLEGYNVISCNGYGIWTYFSTIRFQGDGTLDLTTGEEGLGTAVVMESGQITINSQTNGIRCYSLTVNGGTLNINAADNGISGIGGAYLPSLTITGGAINIDAGADGIYLEFVTIDGGTLVARTTGNQKDACAINSYAALDVASGYLVLASTEPYGDLSLYDASQNDSYKQIVIGKSLSRPTVTATSDSASGKPMLTWNAIDGAEKYEIHRANSQSSTYTLVGTTTDTSYLDTSAPAGSRYYYRVKAMHPDSEWYSVFGATRSALSRLSRPVVTVKSDTATGKPAISWDAVEGVYKYVVYRSTSESGTYSSLGTTTSTSYTDTTAVAGKTYYYKVRAAHKTSTYNSTLSAIATGYAKCARPTVTITNNSSTGNPVLKWSAVDGVYKYVVYRSASKSGTYSSLGTTTSTSYTDTTAVAGKTYYYKVRAAHKTSTYNSALSAIITGYAKCARPTVTITNSAATGKPVLKWSAVDGVYKYVIYRSTSKSGTYSSLGTTTSTSYTDTSAVAGKTYYYKVRTAHKTSTYNSALSAVQSRLCDLARPIAKVSLNSKGKPVIKWAKISGATKYGVYVYNSSGTLIKTYTTTNLSLTHSAAVKGKTYMYRVAALHSVSGANSAKSVAVSITSK